MTLFDDGLSGSRANAPLAVRLRPRCVEDVIGQEAALAEGSPLRTLLTSPADAPVVSVVLWGPPGIGKTTIASLLSAGSGRSFVELSAVTAGVKDVRAMVDEARDRLALHGRGTVLFIDEVHRFSKSQQDALLPAVENGWVTLIAATTENPSFSVIAPLMSRSVLVRLAPLTDEHISVLLDRALDDPRGFGGSLTIDDDARDHLIRTANGDGRRALTGLEAAGVSVSSRITLADAERAVQQAAVAYDKDGDQHYDVISAFIKSVRGSDVHAAMHYLARMLEAGEDPRYIARRLLILASEDIGMADPSALLTASAAANAVATLGMPEARITLAHATVHLALAPKSNAVMLAIDSAIEDVQRGGIGNVPKHLRDGHSPGARVLGHGASYVYPHDLAAGIAAQQYLPDALVGREYYLPTERGAEARWGEIARRASAALAGEGLGLPDDDTQ